jgi:hypothetical protein
MRPIFIFTQKRSKFGMGTACWTPTKAHFFLIFLYGHGVPCPYQRIFDALTGVPCPYQRIFDALTGVPLPICGILTKIKKRHARKNK